MLLFQDKAELGCLRSIVLFNPDAKGLEQAPAQQVESFREKVYATLEEYCRTNHENEPSRCDCVSRNLCSAIICFYVCTYYCSAIAWV